MAKAVHAYWDTMEMRPFTLMKSTFAGSGKYGQHMLRGSEGEWKDMRLAIAGMMNFNMFGIPMVGADVCGSWSTNVTANQELCGRWFQLATFMPFARQYRDEQAQVDVWPP